MQQPPHSEEPFFYRDHGDTEKLTSLGELLEGLAHELNSPISAILSYSEMLQSPDIQEKSRDKYVDNIHMAALRASKVIDGLLTLLRAQKSEFTSVPVNNIVRKTVPLFEYQLRDKGISLILDLASGLPFVRGDYYRLQQVLFNLLMNAMQALSAWEGEKRIIITSSAADQSVRIVIEDSGPGIRPEHYDKIFVPFFTTKPKGTGLGLSIARSILREHGGDISIVSGSHGCRITVELPANSDAAIAQAVEEQGKSRPQNRVLIIDDDEMVVDTFCSIMENVGYDVSFATSAPDALEKLRSEIFDLIFVDYRMPHMDGVAFIEEALTLVDRKSLVLITGDPGFRNNDFSARFSVPVLRKPFNLEELRLFIRKHFQRKLGHGV